MTKMMKILLISLLVFLTCPAFAEFVFEEYSAEVILLDMEHIGQGSWTLYLGTPPPETDETAQAVQEKTAAARRGNGRTGRRGARAEPDTSEAEQEEEIPVDFIIRTQLECPFFNSRGNRVTPDEFFVNNEKQVITIEFVEYVTAPGNYVIMSCQGA